MEDEESGGSAYSSSDGGSRSWPPSPSYEATQLLSHGQGGYGRLEPTQLLSNDFYTRQFSRQQKGESDEDFEEKVEEDEKEGDEEGDELELQRQAHERVVVEGDEDGSESDYDGVYEETQLLEQYNKANYSKVEHEEKLRSWVLMDLTRFTDNGRQQLGGEKVKYEETQLLGQYGSNLYGRDEYEKGRVMHGRLTVETRDVDNWQDEKVDSEAEITNEAEHLKSADKGAISNVEDTRLKQDRQEVLCKVKPNSEFRQVRMCEFDMDLNVSLEEQMECYEEPNNCSTQLVTNSETQLVNEFHSWQGDTQLVTSTAKDSFESLSSRLVKAGATDVKEAFATRGNIDCKQFEGSTTCNEAQHYENDKILPVSNGGVKILTPYPEPKASSSSSLELRSLTTDSTISTVPSLSEVSEGTPLCSNIGTVRAESMRVAALQPLTWLPKLTHENHKLSISEYSQPHETIRRGGKSVEWNDLSLSEPEWMRDFGCARNSLDERIAALVPSFKPSAHTPLSVKNSKVNGMVSFDQSKMAEKVYRSRQSCTSGTKLLVGSSNLHSTSYEATASKPDFVGRGSEPRTTLQRPRSFGRGVTSPTGSMNYLDSSEPGEDVQAQALDMVEKLVWLNTADGPQTSPPRKPKKSFSGLPPVSSTLSDPALQVYEFEDTPLAEPSQKAGDVSLIKEIQAGWKKKAEAGYLFPKLRKGKEKETVVLPEGERLTKLMTEDNQDVTCEPRLLLNVSSTKRISARLQDKGEVCLQGASLQSPGTKLVGSKGRVTDFESDKVAQQTTNQDGMLAEPTELTGAGVVDVTMQKQSDTKEFKPDELVDYNTGQGDGKDDNIDVAHTWTKRRARCRNRREHIHVPEVLLLPENGPSPDGRLRLGCETERNPYPTRKRRSLNTMLQDRSNKKARLKVDGHVENQFEVNETFEIMSSNTSSGADPMHGVTESPSRVGWTTTVDTTEKFEDKVVVKTELPERRGRRRRPSEASKLLGAGGRVGELSEDGFKTRSLRQLPRLSCANYTSIPFSSGMVQKRLRSVRRGHGGGQGAPRMSNVDGECELNNETDKRASTSTWSATSEGDSEDDGVEVDGVSGPENVEEVEETSSDEPSHVDEPVEHADESGGRAKRTRSIADVSSPTTRTTLFHPVPFPLVTGRRGRGAVMKSDMEEANLQYQYSISVVPAARKGLRMRTMRKRRDPQRLALPARTHLELLQEESASASTEGSLRTRVESNVCVLFSHGLSEETVKKQRKICERLAGKVTKNAADCTHFVAEKFVRTGNMLEAMAAGKFVVTFAWLESCHRAKCFIEEWNFILEDEMKEKDLGFSMRSTLLAAQQKPLLHGIRVLLTPNINPKPQAIAAIVHAAGGQVVDEYKGPASAGNNEDSCVVISNEDDYDFCVPFLEQGAKVYKSELILSGIVSYHLDFPKYPLFENF